MRDNYIKTLIKILEESNINELEVTTFWGRQKIRLQKTSQVNDQNINNQNIVLDETSDKENISNINQPLNKEELLNQLKKTEIVSCKDVTFRFLGLSLATINTVISLILSGIMIKIIKNYGKN